MSQIAPHGGALIKWCGRYGLLRHSIGASKHNAMRGLREVNSLTWGYQSFLRGLQRWQDLPCIRLPWSHSMRRPRYLSSADKRI